MGILLEYDKQLANKAILHILRVNDDIKDGKSDLLPGVGLEEIARIGFQFPPKVTADNRGTNWKEIDIPSAQESIAVLAGASSREITLEWTYVVTESGSGAGDLWDAKRIHDQLIKLRRYFGGNNDVGTIDKLVVLVKLWEIGGPESMTFRMISANVKYGTTYYIPKKNDRDLDYDKAFPLRTDVSVNLKSWTRSGAQIDKNLVGLSDEDASLATVDIKHLKTGTPLRWF